MDTPHAVDNRLHISCPVAVLPRFREDVIAGLSAARKSLPPRYFYDQYGSELFEQICQQPEYYPTRTEAVLLRQQAAELLDLVGECTLVELGSGSSVKTRLLLDEYQRRDSPMHYVPIDISASMLEESAQGLIADYPRLSVHGLATDYLSGLAALPPARQRLVLFLGSNLGNFNDVEQAELFGRLATALQPQDYFLLGLDLRKSITILEAAYNDAAGVTAAFNLNMLRRINREFGANFNLSQFRHLAFYNRDQHQIEMHLQSELAQEVEIAELGLRVFFAPQETIHTEISRKFDARQVAAQLRPYGFEPCARWTDERAWFLLHLFRFVGR